MNQKGVQLIVVTNNSKQYMVLDSNKEGRKQTLQKFREWQDQCGTESIPRKSLVEKVGVELDFISSGMDRVTLLGRKKKIKKYREKEARESKHNSVTMKCPEQAEP